MKITEVEVRYGRTHSLDGYGNVRPEIGYTATIDETESPSMVVGALLHDAKAFVRNEIDMALEDNGESPVFFTGSRYDVFYSIQREAVVVVPQLTSLPPDFSSFNNFQGHRLVKANKKAQELANKLNWR